MRRNFKWKMIFLFCFTFLIGFISVDMADFIVSNGSNTSHTDLNHQQKVNSALKSVGQGELQCVPLDKNLEYLHIKEKKAEESENPDSLETRSDLYVEQIEIENRLRSKTNLNKSQKDEYQRRLKEIEEELLEIIKNMKLFRREDHESNIHKDLLYREICSQN